MFFLVYIYIYIYIYIDLEPHRLCKMYFIILDIKILLMDVHMSKVVKDQDISPKNCDNYVFLSSDINKHIIVVTVAFRFKC